jgi:hypothetical protein
MRAAQTRKNRAMKVIPATASKNNNTSGFFIIRIEIQGKIKKWVDCYS